MVQHHGQWNWQRFTLTARQVTSHELSGPANADLVQVIGVDISPQLKPDETPENFEPQLDDINLPFTFESNTFDLVQSRMVGGGINTSRWPSYLRDIKR